MSNTIPRFNDKVDGPYCSWIRLQDDLDSKTTGVRAYDTDLNVFNKSTLQLFQLEEKTNSTMPRPDQVMVMQMHRIAWETSDKERIKAFLNVGMPYKPLDFESKTVQYNGYWLLVYETNNLNNGSASLFRLQDNGVNHMYDFAQNDNERLLQWTKCGLGIASEKGVEEKKF